MKIVIITLTAVFFTTSAWSQTNITNGAPQTALLGPTSGNKWNQHPFVLYDSTGDTYSGKYLIYWSCGGGSQDGICVATETPTGAYANQAQIITVSGSGTICDMQDPGVVKYGSTYYLYAAGVMASGNCNAVNSSGNQHAAIYGWSSPNGVTTWTPLNFGKPVIQFAIDTSNHLANASGTPAPCFSGAPSCYTGHGINGPTPVVMQSCSCIRMYYWYEVLNPPSSAPAGSFGLISIGQGIEAQDSTDGTNFNISSERVIYPGPYWQQVKRTGLNGSDYPLVMTLTNGGANQFITAISDGFSDTAWYCTYTSNCTTQFTANTNNQIGYPPHLESDVSGLLLDTSRNPVSVAGLTSGELLNLYWDNGDGTSVTTGGSLTSYIYRGNTPGLNLFPTLAADPVPWLTEFIPSSYPNNTGATQTFYIQGEDQSNGSAITYLQPFLSISSDLSSTASSCHLLYSSSNNTLYLDNSAGNFVWAGNQPQGGSWTGSNSNGVCQVNSWSTSVSGQYLTLTVNVTFQPGGPWYEFGSVSNTTGSSPWITNGLSWIY